MSATCKKCGVPIEQQGFCGACDIFSTAAKLGEALANAVEKLRQSVNWKYVGEVVLHANASIKQAEFLSNMLHSKNEGVDLHLKLTHLE